MMGTFGGALAARHVDASDARLTAEVRGEVEAEDGVLVIRRIHVAMRLIAPENAREVVDRFMECMPCGVRSIGLCIGPSRLYRRSRWWRRMLKCRRDS